MKIIKTSISIILGITLFLSLHLLNTYNSSAQQPRSSALFDDPYIQRLAEADTLYLAGKTSEAEEIYRQVKEPFPDEADLGFSQPFDDPELLSPKGGVFWRVAQEGLDQGLESKLFIALDNLIETDPTFVPGHRLRIEASKKYKEEEDVLAAIESAASQFPNSVELTRLQIAALEEEKQWLEASIAARQFALINSDHPDAAEFLAIADKDLKRFKGKIKGETISGGILGGALGIVTGDRGQSMVQFVSMMLMGESDLGAQLAASYKAQLPIVEDPVISGYINELGQSIAELMGRDEFTYEFYVVKDDALNAFALPGGKVFVNTGSIMRSRSEAELAGLLGHEVAHAVLSHGYRMVSKQGIFASLARTNDLVAIASNLSTLDYSRGNERQSDLLGTRAIAVAGYAADGLYNFMSAVKEESNSAQLEYLSSHPIPKNRLIYLQELIERNGYNRYAFEGVKEYTEIKQRLQELI